MVTKAAVLCGGEGTRLRPLFNGFQKTMIPIGPNKRPLLEYVLRLFTYYEVTNLTLLTGYKSEQIEKYFGNGDAFGVKIAYSKDPEKAKGSAQSLSFAIARGKLGDFDELVVYYGDVLSALNVRELVAKHRSDRAALTMVLTKDYRVPVGLAQVEGGRVTAFSEKPRLPLNATVGCLVLSKESLPVLKEVTDGGGRDIMADFVPKVIERGMKVSPYYLEGFWRDIGTIEAYEKLDPKIFEEGLSFLD